MKKRLLAIDDDPLVCELVEQALGERFRVRTARSARHGLAVLDEFGADLVLLDVRLPDGNGHELLPRILDRPRQPTVIMMTAESSVEGAVSAMQAGAFHYLRKPVSLHMLESLVSRAEETLDLTRENQQLRREVGDRFAQKHMIGRSAAMQTVFETVEMVADTRSTVLIQGDTGTGKELIARAIHYGGPDAERPFIKVNCAALPESLLESELFGHEKGAFTGAERRVMGKFELADGGTILLDEISEIQPSLQAKLLRVLQEREFYRVGGNSMVRTQCRVIATTNRNLRREVERQAFREDLYYRLNVVPIRVPNLRERASDVPFLIAHFLDRYNRETGKSVEFTEDVIAYLSELHWRGNVRELENFVERAVVMSRNNLVALSNMLIPEDEPAPDDLPFRVGMSVRDTEKTLILRTLEHTEWNRTRAAEMLEISIRTLRNKLHEYRAEDETVVPPPGARR